MRRTLPEASSPRRPRCPTAPASADRPPPASRSSPTTTRPACTPSAATDPAIAELRRVYPAVEPVEDALSAALLNSNGSLHAPLVLLNAAPIERLGAYDIHVEGTTPGVKRVIEALDAERMALREALGYRSAHWPLMDYYRDADWFYGPGAFSRVQRDSVWRERSTSAPLRGRGRRLRLVLWSSLAGAGGADAAQRRVHRPGTR